MFEWALVGFCALVLAACGVEKSASEQDKKIVETAIQSLADGNEHALSALLGDEMIAGMAKQSAGMRNLLPANGVANLKIVRGVQNLTYPNEGGVAELEYEVTDGATYSIVRAAVGDRPLGRKLIGLYVNRLPTSVDVIGGFSLSGKSPKQYAFLALTAVSPIIILTAIWLILRAGPFPYRWLWGIGSLLAICSFRMNWYTGETGIELFYIQILGGGASKVPDPTASWILAFGFPLAAVMFLALRPDRNK